MVPQWLARDSRGPSALSALVRSACSVGLRALALASKVAATGPRVWLRLLHGRRKILVEKIFTFVEKHVGAGPAGAASVYWRLAEVYLSFDVLDYADARVIELHPLPLALYNGVVVPELEALTLVHDDSLKMVPDFLTTRFSVQLLREGDPVA